MIKVRKEHSPLQVYFGRLDDLSPSRLLLELCVEQNRTWPECIASYWGPGEGNAYWNLQTWPTAFVCVAMAVKTRNFGIWSNYIF